jgi:hypothetical protein
VRGPQDEGDPSYFSVAFSQRDWRPLRRSDSLCWWATSGFVQTETGNSDLAAPRELVGAGFPGQRRKFPNCESPMRWNIAGNQDYAACDPD